MVKKRLHAFNNPEKIAFCGWHDELEPLSLATCKDYMEWYFNTMIFALHCDQLNYRFNKENLKYALNEEFKTQCIHVYLYLYDE